MKSLDEKSSVAVSSIFDVFRQTTHISVHFSATKVPESLSARNCETLIQVTPTLGSTVQNNVSKSLLSNVAAFFPVSFGLVFHVCFLSFGSFGFCLLCVEFVCLIWTAFPYLDFPYVDFLLIDHCLIIWVRLLVLLPPCFPC